MHLAAGYNRHGAFFTVLTENEQCFLLKNIIAVSAEIPEKYLRFKFFIITCYNRFLCA